VPAVEPTVATLAEEATEAPAVEESIDEAPGPEPVTLTIRASNPEYEQGEIQIWALYQDENPHVTLDFFSVTEGASSEAYDAKLAGGWVPALDWHKRATPANYKEFVNLLETDFPWFDRWEYDITTAFENRFGIPGVYAANIIAGFVWTWQYHEDLMEEAGLDPQKDVKTWDDMKEWLRAGTEWANANPDIEYFWDQAGECWWCITQYFDAWPLAFPDGQREQQRKAWVGEIPINGPDSPYRHAFEFLLEAYNEGWLPKEFWTHSWEPDMEANYISKRSVVMLHGPWVWDKALAADPTVQQAGLPCTPPAEGQDTWVQYMSSPEVNTGCFMHAQVLDLPEYPEIQKAFNWWLSPRPVKLTAELWGMQTLYRTDEPVELSGPQWVNLVSQIGTPGGVFEDVVMETGDMGVDAAAQYLTEEGILWSNWEWAGEVVAPMCQGEITVQDALDWFKTEIDRNYSLPS
jgi:ABC-type glycerol-3-phosphate transport system substrate-binding protein